MVIGKRLDVLPSNFLWMKPSCPIGLPITLSGAPMLAFFKKLYFGSRAAHSSEVCVRVMTVSERNAMEALTLQMHEVARIVLLGRARRFSGPRP
jgi:hypothetical protein